MQGRHEAPGLPMAAPGLTAERIGLFIDGASLYGCSKALNCTIDYKKLLDFFRTRGRLIRAHYYTALYEDLEYCALRPLVDWLNYNGFAVVTKPAKEFTDHLGRRKVKFNMEVELAVDALELAPYLDHLVLFSGDGDLRRLVEAVQRRGVRVTVVATARPMPALIADELRRQADHFVDLADLISVVTRTPMAMGLREDRREAAAQAIARGVIASAIPVETGWAR